MTDPRSERRSLRRREPRRCGRAAGPRPAVAAAAIRWTTRRRSTTRTPAAARSCRSPTSRSASTRSSWPQLPIQLNGTTTTNTCAGSGCHDNANGTGGAFRVVADARPSRPHRSGEHGRRHPRQRHVQELLLGAGRGGVRLAAQSRLLWPSRWCTACCTAAADLRRTRHDANAQADRVLDQPPGAARARTSSARATYSMFTPADPNTGTCNTQ